MKKFELVEVLKERGFVEQPIEEGIFRFCDAVRLERSWSKEVEVAWYGKRIATYSIEVFVNQSSGICRVWYYQDGREYKNRWYNTLGKRTYNAMVETARCAGYEF